MRIAFLLLYASLFVTNYAAVAATPEEVLHKLQAVLGTGDINAFEVACKEGLLSKSYFAFRFDPARRLLFTGIRGSLVGNYLWANTLLITGEAGTKLSDGFHFVEAEIKESSAGRLVIHSKLAVGMWVVDQNLIYNRQKRLIAIQDGSFGPRSLRVCHLK